MENLTVYDVATRNVSFVEDTATIQEAINKIEKSELRTIVVKKKNKNSFSILTAGDFFNFKIKKLDFSTKINKIKIKQIEKVHKDTSIISMLDKISNSESYRIVVDEKDSIIGILSCSDIISGIDPELLIKKQSIGNFLNNHFIKTAFANESTLNVISYIKDKVDGAVVIVENEIPIGIFTTKDIIKLLKSKKDLTRPIRNYMISPVEYIKQDISISEALDYIKTKKFKRIVVVDNNNKLLGKITQQDLMKLFYSKWVEMLKHKGTKLNKANKQLDKKYQKLVKKASKDYLTKVFTRNRFDEYISIEIEKIKRYNNSMFSLAIIDIDDFKHVNDTYGHLEGDNVLKIISKFLKKHARTSDVVARWGGEEFVVLLTNTHLEDSIIVAEKFCSAIRKYDFKNIGKITCSIGLTSYKTGDTKESIFARADKAMYLSKQSGKDRVSIEA